MRVLDKKPVPIYTVICHECKSKIEYKAAEVSWCHITCPVCGVGVWANTICPERMDGGEEDGEKYDEAD